MPEDSSSRDTVAPPLPGWLSGIFFTRVSIRLRACESGRLRRFRTSMLRGWLSYQLKSLCPCRIIRGLTPERCTLQNTCAYSAFFGERKLSTIPRPYVLAMDPLREDGEDAFSENDELLLGLTLIGRGTEYLDGLISAVVKSRDLVHLGRDHLTFAIQGIETLDAAKTPHPYYRAGYIVGYPEILTVDTLLRESQVPVRHDSTLCITFDTPLALKEGNKLVKTHAGITFELLFRATLRRLYDIAVHLCAYRGTKPAFQGILEQAHQVKTLHTAQEWIDFRRFSSRQRRFMNFGGFVGGLEVAGSWSPLLPYLLLGAQLHVGRRTTFGFGSYQLHWE